METWYENVRLVLGDNIQVISDKEKRTQTIASKYNILNIGKAGQVVNLNTADTYNFSEIKTLSSDLLIQPASGYLVKIGEGRSKHLAEELGLEGIINGERSLLVTGMLEVQREFLLMLIRLSQLWFYGSQVKVSFYQPMMKVARKYLVLQMMVSYLLRV